MADCEGPFGKTGELTGDECRRLIENAAYEMATLYYHMAKTFTGAYGDAGKALIRKAIHDWGTEKGRVQRRNVERMGLEPGLETIKLGATMPWDIIMEGEPSSFENGALHMKCTRCPLADIWRELGAQDLALLYCDEVDIAKWRAFDGEVEVERPQAMMRGDAACEFSLTIRPHNDDCSEL